MVTKGQRIARARAKGHDALRRIFFEGDCLKVLSGDQNGYVPEATYTDGWWLDNREYSDVVLGRKYKRLVVDDVDGCRLDQLRAATAVQIGDLRFKFVAKPTFFGSLPTWEFRLQTTGERV